MRWRSIVIYLLFLATLFSAALIKRHLQFRSLCVQLTAQINKPANNGRNNDMLLGEYFYGSYTSNSANPWSGSVQGPAIFLLKRGYMDDALARAVLLTEARRLNDWQYTYASVYNYDLRRYLIERCLRAYPDDLKVAWASGALSLAAGDDTLALEQLARIIGRPEQWPACVGLCNQLGISPEHMLGRYCAALTLHGRDADAGELLRALQANDDRAAHCYLRYLADCSRYDELLRLATDPNSPYQPTPSELATWNYEAALHKGDWPQVSTHGIQKAQLKIRELESAWGEYYSFRLTPDLMESALMVLFSETGSETVASLRVRYIKLAANKYPWLGALTADISALETFPVFARLYGASGDKRWLLPLQDGGVAPNKHYDWYEREASAQLARAHLLRNEFVEAKLALGEDIDTYFPSTIESAPILLTVLANGSSLNIEIRPESGDSYGEAATGWLHTIRESDTLTYLLRSPQFAAALKHSGRSLNDVLPEIRTVTQPYRGTYYDSANGELHAIQHQLNLPTN